MNSARSWKRPSERRPGRRARAKLVDRAAGEWDRDTDDYHRERYMAGRIATGRMDAVNRSRAVALRFQASTADYQFAPYVDGNGQRRALR